MSNNKLALYTSNANGLRGCFNTIKEINIKTDNNVRSAGI
ncbi:hypothetical protein J568_3619, partial [Acinetobacter baumannii 6112]